jgi:hypothetical protein
MPNPFLIVRTVFFCELPCLHSVIVDGADIRLLPRYSRLLEHLVYRIRRLDCLRHEVCRFIW